MEGNSGGDQTVNAEFLQNVQSAVNSTGVVGRVGVIETENGPMTVIFMDESTDLGATAGSTTVSIQEDGTQLGVDNKNTNYQFQFVDSGETGTSDLSGLFDAGFQPVNVTDAETVEVEPVINLGASGDVVQSAINSSFILNDNPLTFVDAGAPVMATQGNESVIQVQTTPGGDVTEVSYTATKITDNPGFTSTPVHAPQIMKKKINKTIPGASKQLVTLPTGEPVIHTVHGSQIQKAQTPKPPVQTMKSKATFTNTSNQVFTVQKPLSKQVTSVVKKPLITPEQVEDFKHKLASVKQNIQQDVTKNLKVIPTNTDALMKPQIGTKSGLKTTMVENKLKEKADSAVRAQQEQLTEVKDATKTAEKQVDIDSNNSEFENKEIEELNESEINYEKTDVDANAIVYETDQDISRDEKDNVKNLEIPDDDKEVVSRDLSSKILCDIQKNKMRFESETKAVNDIRVDHQESVERKMPCKCDKCNLVFKTVQNFNNHKLIHSKEVQCKICGKVCGNKMGLQSHTRHIHTGFKCPECHLIFKNEEKCNTHMKESNHKGATIAKQEGLNVDNVEHTEEDPQEMLKNIFGVKKSNTKSVKSIEDEVYVPTEDDYTPKGAPYYNEEKGWQCNECKKYFMSKESRKRHKEKKHVKSAEFKCKHCRHMFKSGRVLRKHERKVHTGPWVCKLCKNVYEIKTDYISHAKSHRAIKCRKCDDTFQSSRDLVIHKRKCGVSSVEPAVKKQDSKTSKIKDDSRVECHLCEQCGRSFSHKRSYIAHIKVHAGYRPYKCKTCEVGYMKKESLERHIPVCGSESEVKRIAERKRRHERLLIFGKKKFLRKTGPYLCNLCSRGFSMPSALSLHKRLTHKITKFKRTSALRKNGYEMLFWKKIPTLEKKKLSFKRNENWNVNYPVKDLTKDSTGKNNSAETESLFADKKGTEGQTCLYPSNNNKSKSNENETQKSTENDDEQERIDEVETKQENETSSAEAENIVDIDDKDTIPQDKSDVNEDKLVKIFRCTFCWQCFKELQEAKDHAVVHRKVCSVCNKKCHDYSTLIRHKIAIHYENSAKTVCTKCEKAFSGHSLLLTHMTDHYGPWVCEYKNCDYSCTEKKDLLFHKNDHSKVRNRYLCSCGLLFKSKPIFIKHLNKGECDLSEDAESVLRARNCKPSEQDKDITSDISEISNKYTQVPFSDVDKYIEVPGRFTESELGQIPVPHKCLLCNAQFSTITCTKKHIRMMHCKDDKTKAFRCELCDFATHFQYILTKHLKVHKRPFPCSYCTVSFDSLDKLTKHSQAHFEDKYQCYYCSKVYRTKKSCKDHILANHYNEESQELSQNKEDEMNEVVLPVIRSKEQHQPTIVETIVNTVPEIQDNLFQDLQGPLVDTNWDHDIDISAMDLPVLSEEIFDNVPATSCLTTVASSTLATNITDCLATAVTIPPAEQFPGVVSHENLKIEVGNQRIEDSIRTVFQPMSPVEEPANQSSIPTADCKEMDQLLEVENDDQSLHWTNLAEHDYTDTRTNMNTITTIKTEVKSEHKLPASGDDVIPPGYEMYVPIRENYKCDGCGNEFEWEKDFRNHLFTDHMKDALCTICDKEFQSKWVIRSHMKKEHCVGTPLVCPKCGDGFKESEKYWSHVAKHANLFSCTTCNKSFSQKGDLKSHMSIHEKRNYICTTCGELFNDRLEWRKHEKIAHTVFGTDDVEMDNKDRETKDIARDKDNFKASINTSTSTQYFVDSHGQLVTNSDVTNTALDNQQMATKQPTPQPSLAKPKFQTIEVPGTDLTIQVYGDGTLVTSDKLGTNYSNINLDDLGLDPNMLQGEANIELVIVQGDGKEVRATINTNLSNLQNSVVDDSISEVDEKTFYPTKGTKLVKNNENDSRPFKCSMCPRTFKFQRTFKCHENVHLQDKVFMCSICKRVFARETNLKSHLELHSKLKNREVITVDKKSLITQSRQKKQFRSKEEIERDRYKVDWNCDRCTKAFTTIDKLKKHQKYVHEKIDATACPICKKMFTTKAAVQRHVKTHVGPFNCSYCTTICKTQDDLINHMKEDHEKKIFICPICNEDMINKKTFYKHLRNEHEDHPKIDEVLDKWFVYSCEECGRSFRTSSMLNRHLVVHKNSQNDMKCPEPGCLFTCNGAGSLYAHKKRKHLGKFKCSICGEGMQTKQRIDNHNKLYHKGTYTCTECSEPFKDSRLHQKHLQDEHNKSNYQCDKCDESFPSKKAENDHKRQNHGNCLCDVCGAGFILKGDLKHHMIKVHFEGDKEEMLKTYPHMKNVSDALACEICDVIFRTKMAIKKHYKIIHFDDDVTAMYAAYPNLETYPDPPDDAVCDECGKAFNRLSNLYSHKKTHGMEISFAEFKKNILHESAGNVNDDEDFDDESDASAEDDTDFSNIQPRESVKKYKCKKCNLSFAREAAYKKHVNLHTEKEETNEALAQVEEDEFERAEAEERGETLFSKLKSPKTVKTSKAVNETSSSRHVCSFCDRIFKTKAVLNKHLKQVHNATLGSAVGASVGKRKATEQDVETPQAGKRKRTNTHICNHCEEMFKTEFELDMHMDEFHNDADNEQEYANDNNEDKDKIAIPKELQDYQYSTCQYCNKNLSRPATLRKHIKQFHSDVHTIKSENEMPKTQNELPKTPETPRERFYCKLCTCNYANRKDLKRHHLKNHKDDPYEGPSTETPKHVETTKTPVCMKDRLKCSLCEANYAHSKDLKRHHFNCHENEPYNGVSAETPTQAKTTPKNKTERFYCPLCDANYAYNQDLNKHIAKKHTDTETTIAAEVDGDYRFDNDTSTSSSRERFNCSLCPANYAFKTDLKKHMAKKHAEDKEEKNDDIETMDTDGEEQASMRSFLGMNFNLTKKQSPLCKMATVTTKRHKCRLCGEGFNREATLKKHMLFHNPESDGENPNSDNEIFNDLQKALYQCKECGTMYSTTTGLLTHTKTKHPELDETAVQESIDKIDNDNNDVSETPKTRIKSESEVTKSVKRTAETQIKGDYQKRMKIDDAGKKSFPCNFCPVLYSTYHGVMNHEKMIHLDRLAEKNNETPRVSQSGRILTKSKRLSDLYSCGHCSKVFDSDSSRKMHTTVVHKDKKVKPIVEKSKTEISHIKINGGYKCSICSQIYAELYLLKKHTDSKHSIKSEFSPNTKAKTETKAFTKTENGFQCVLCSKVFSELSNMKRHSYGKHRIKIEDEISNTLVDESQSAEGPNEDDVYECDICERNFSTLKGLKKHMTAVHDETEDDSKTTESLASPKTPIKQEEDGKQDVFECDLCSKLFTDFSNLKRHMTMKHPEIKQDLKQLTKLKTESLRRKNIHQCEHCVKQFTSLVSLKMHLRMAHKTTYKGSVTKDDKPTKLAVQEVKIKTEQFECSVCQKEFILQKNLTIHMRKHTGEVPYCCSQCDKRFISRFKLQCHLKKEHAADLESMVKCKVCLALFDNRDLMLEHRISHKKSETVVTEFKQDLKEDKPLETAINKTYKCDKCDKAFKWRQNLTSHVRLIHSDREQVVCGVCNKVFPDKTSITKHMAIHNIQKYSCRFCSRTFKKEMFLQSHIAAFHKKSKRPAKELICNICNSGFETKEDLLDHMLSHTSISNSPSKSKHTNQRTINSPSKNVKNSPRTTPKRLKEDLNASKGDDKPFKCKFCSNAYQLEHGLKTHMGISHRKELDTINKADSENKTKPVNKTNEQTQASKSNGFTCKYCGKTMSNTWNLKVHLLRMHKKSVSKLRPGSLISKSFLNKKRKIVQQAIAEKSKQKISSQIVHHNYCKKCDVQFSSRSNYMRHVNKQHENVNEKKSKTMSKTISLDRYCNLCDVTFSTRANYRKHYKKRHQNSLKFYDNFTDMEIEGTNCPECPLEFKLRASLKQHMKQLHNLNLIASEQQEYVKRKCFSCSLCASVFWSKETYTSHLQHIHPHQAALSLDMQVLQNMIKTEVVDSEYEASVNKTIAQEGAHDQPTKISPTKHRQPRFGPVKHKCEFCLRVHWTKKSFDEHMNNYHADEVRQNELNKEVVAQVSTSIEALNDNLYPTNLISIEMAGNVPSGCKKLSSMPVVVLDRLAEGDTFYCRTKVNEDNEEEITDGIESSTNVRDANALHEADDSDSNDIEEINIDLEANSVEVIPEFGINEAPAYEEMIDDKETEEISLDAMELEATEGVKGIMADIVNNEKGNTGCSLVSISKESDTDLEVVNVNFDLGTPKKGKFIEPSEIEESFEQNNDTNKSKRYEETVKAFDLNIERSTDEPKAENRSEDDMESFDKLKENVNLDDCLANTNNSIEKVDEEIGNAQIEVCVTGSKAEGPIVEIIVNEEVGNSEPINEDNQRDLDLSKDDEQIRYSEIVEIKNENLEIKTINQGIVDVSESMIIPNNIIEDIKDEENTLILLNKDETNIESHAISEIDNTTNENSEEQTNIESCNK